MRVNILKGVLASCLIVVAVSYVSAQNYDEINYKNIKKYEGNCKSIYVTDNSDAYIEKKNLETHRITMTEKNATNVLHFTLFRNANDYQFRIHDKEKDIRGYGKCKIKLGDDTELSLTPADPFGEKLDKGGFTRRSFKITAEQLKQMEEKHVKFVRLEREKEHINYPVDAEQNNVLKPILNCLMN